jgi:hypothetical protein
MPKLAWNIRTIAKTINGAKAVYSIDKHPGLYLEVLGEGRASWRLRYRPRRGAPQRWFTIATDARNADFVLVARRAAELMHQLKIDGIDPHDATRQQAREGMTYNQCYEEWIASPARPRALRPRTLDQYGRLHKLHVSPYVGDIPLRALDKQTIIAAIEKVRRASTDESRDWHGLQATQSVEVDP